MTRHLFTAPATGANLGTSPAPKSPLRQSDLARLDAERVRRADEAVAKAAEEPRPPRPSVNLPAVDFTRRPPARKRPAAGLPVLVPAPARARARPSLRGPRTRSSWPPRSARS